MLFPKVPIAQPAVAACFIIPALDRYRLAVVLKQFVNAACVLSDHPAFPSVVCCV
jgi:hypothetical protein